MSNSLASLNLQVTWQYLQWLQLAVQRWTCVTVSVTAVKTRHSRTRSSPSSITLSQLDQFSVANDRCDACNCLYAAFLASISSAHLSSVRKFDARALLQAWLKTVSATDHLNKLRYDTIRYEMLFWRALESRHVSLIYRTEPTTKKV